MFSSTRFFIILFCAYIFVKSNPIEVENEIDVFWKNIPIEEVQQQQSENMQKYLNESVNPCEDFNQYACGNWLKYHPNIDRHYVFSPIFQVRDQQLQVAIKKFITSTDLNEDIMTVEGKIKVYYSTCVENYRKNKTDFNEFLRIFENFGSAPLWNLNWESDNFKWTELAGFAYRNDIPIFFEVNLDTNIIRSISSSDLESSEQAEKYKVFIENVLKLTGIDSETANHLASDIFEIEVQLKDIQVQDDRNQEFESISIEDFLKKYPEIDWINSFADVSHLSKQIKVQANINQILEFINGTKSENIANYIFWRILKACIENNLFDNRYMNEYKEYKMSINADKTDDSEERCYKEIMKYFAVPKTLFYAKYFQIDEKYINKLIEELREILINDYQKIELIPSEIDTVDDYIKKFRLEIVPNVEYSVEELNKIFEVLKISPKTYFQNYFNLKYFSKKSELMKKFPIYFEYEYNKRTQKLPILTEIFLPPNYHKEFSDALNLGGIGTSILERIITSIPLSMTQEKFLHDRATDLVECYKKIYEFENPCDSRIYYQSFIIEKLYKIYEKWSTNENNMNNQKLPGFDATPEQLFFINYMQNRCVFTIDTLAKVDDVMLALTNHRGFAEAFSCPIGSKMNPEMKCKNFF